LISINDSTNHGIFIAKKQDYGYGHFILSIRNF